MDQPASNPGCNGLQPWLQPTVRTKFQPGADVLRGPTGARYWPRFDLELRPGRDTMNPQYATEDHVGHARTQSALRRVVLLVGAYLGLSVLTVVAIVLLRDHRADVNSAVWTRGIIVAAVALLTFAFTVRAARGSSRAYLRLRIVSAIQVVAIAVIVSLPGTFPLWLKVEQASCGLLLLGVVLIANGKQLRSVFDAE
jgi:hypothetical protein